MSRRRTPAHLSPLASINGINPSYLWLPHGPWPTLLAFLCERFAHLPVEGLRARLLAGDIVDDQGQALSLDTPYRSHQRIWYHRQVPDEPELPFAERIVQVHERFIVADKPHFLAANPAGRYLQQTLLTRLRRRFNNPNITPAHRLDRETAGLMLFITQPEWRAPYQTMFQQRRVFKEYRAVAPYRPLSWPIELQSRLEKAPDSICMRLADGESNSHCRIDLLDRHQQWGLYQLQPTTGKQHQLRVQMASLGLGLKNDPWYPVLTDERPDDWHKPLQLLAYQLAFTDPIDGKDWSFRSERQLQWPPTD